MPIPLQPYPTEPDRWIPYNVNFCLFAECFFLDNGEEWLCTRNECILTKIPIDWWAMSLQPRPLISSNPPVGFHKVHDVYAKKTGSSYNLMIVVEDKLI